MSERLDLILQVSTALCRRWFTAPISSSFFVKSYEECLMRIILIKIAAQFEERSQCLIANFNQRARPPCWV